MRLPDASLARPNGRHPAPDLADEPFPERRRVPPEARTPYFTAVREAWRRARHALPLTAGPGEEGGRRVLALALAAYARDGRARGVPVATLLRALDTVVRPQDGGDPTLDAGGARAWAGSALIRAYYAGGTADRSPLAPECPDAEDGAP
jgi:hypothetical protein